MMGGWNGLCSEPPGDGWPPWASFGAEGARKEGLLRSHPPPQLQASARGSVPWNHSGLSPAMATPGFVAGLLQLTPCSWGRVQGHRGFPGLGGGAFPCVFSLPLLQRTDVQLLCFCLISPTPKVSYPIFVGGRDLFAAGAHPRGLGKGV